MYIYMDNSILNIILKFNIEIIRLKVIGLLLFQYIYIQTIFKMLFRIHKFRIVKSIVFIIFNINVNIDPSYPRDIIIIQKTIQTLRFMFYFNHHHHSSFKVWFDCFIWMFKHNLSVYKWYTNM